MSVWGDIRRRGNGQEIKKEDVVEEENAWGDKSLWEWNSFIIKSEIDILKKEQVKLNRSLTDLRRELDSFNWNKKKNYVKCNYKL